jgi:hypothetical protein
MFLTAQATPYSLKVTGPAGGYQQITLTNDAPLSITAYALSFSCSRLRGVTAQDGLLYPTRKLILIPPGASLAVPSHSVPPGCKVEQSAVTYNDGTAAGEKNLLAMMRKKRLGASDELTSLRATLAKAADGWMRYQKLMSALDAEYERAFHNVTPDNSELKGGQAAVLGIIRTEVKDVWNEDLSSGTAETRFPIRVQQILKDIDQWQTDLRAALTKERGAHPRQARFLNQLARASPCIT